MHENARPFSSKCQFVSAIMLVVTIIEIYTIQEWESARYGQNPIHQRHPYKRPLNTQDYRFDLENVPTSPADKTSSLSSESKSNDLSLPEQPLPPTSSPDKMHSLSSESKIKDLPKQATPTPELAKPVQLYLSLKDQLEEHLKNATEKKIILVWVPMFGVKDRLQVDPDICGNCEITYDHSKISDEKTGAVLFHFDRTNKNNMPSTRNPKQLYIYWAIESSATLKVVRGQNLKFETDFHFNDTMTYRRDSGIYQNYDHANALDRIFASGVTPEKLLKEKTKLAVAVVSNCGYTPGARTRMKMLKELKALGFGLEGFGGCFPGGRSFANGKSRGADDFHNAVRKYKFYFSFENSFHCKDYISEKFFNNAIDSLAVPVVWGGTKADYKAVAPPGSFIYADDFASMKELADYLNYLDSNDTAYMDYLRWVTLKPEQMPQYGRQRSYCQICRVLHGINIDDIYNPKFDESNLQRPLFSDGVAPRTVPNLVDWIYGEDNKECFGR